MQHPALRRHHLSFLKTSSAAEILAFQPTAGYRKGSSKVRGTMRPVVAVSRPAISKPSATTACSSF